MPKVKIISAPQFVYLQNGGRIPLVFKGNSYHTTDEKYVPMFQSWAKENNLKSMDDVSKFLSGGNYSAKEARKGHDIGKKGKNFDKIAEKAAEKYGSKEAGERVAGAVLAHLRNKHQDGGQQEQIVAQIQQALQQGATPEQIIEQLVQSGLDPQQAQQIVQQVMQQAQGQQPMMQNGGKIKKYQDGGLSDTDLDKFIDKLIEFEGKQGSAEGKGLTISEFTGGKAKDKTTLKELIKNTYLSEMKNELGSLYDKLGKQMLTELLDYKFNTGRNTGDLLAFANNDITLDEVNSNKNFGTPQAINFNIEQLRAAKDNIYKTTKGGTVEKPTDAYTKSWQPRINYYENLFYKTPEYREDKEGSYKGYLKEPETPYSKDYNFDFKKGEALEYVPKGQHKEKTGFYGGVTEKDLELVKKRNPWFEWDKFDVKNPEDVKRFQRQFNEHTGLNLKVDGFFGQQTATAGIGWGKEEIKQEPKTEEEKKTELEPYKKYGNNFGGIGFWGGARPPYMWAFDRGLPPLNYVDPRELSPIKESPEQQLTEIGRQQKAAQRMMPLGADYSANIANTQEIASRLSSDAISDVEKRNALMKLQTDQFNIGNDFTAQQFNIPQLTNYEQEATARQAVKHSEDMALRQRDYELRQKALREQRELNTLASIYNYGFTPWGSVYHDQSRDVPVNPMAGFPFNLPQQQEETT